MRIDNNNGETVVSNGRSGSIQGLDLAHGSNPAARLSKSGTDLVNLSSATSLLSIAKKMASTGRQSMLDSLAAQLRSGEYQPEPPDISRAVVQGHLER
jgi:hypothetical protein